MNELIKITPDPGSGLSTVSAIELYRYLGYDPSNWAKWYKLNILENSFAIENLDYTQLVVGTNANGSNRVDFCITTDFAKRLAMMAKTEKGEDVRRYFIEIEKRSLPTAPKTTGEMLVLMSQGFAELEGRQLATENKLKELEAKTTATDTNYYTVAGYANLKGVRLDVSKASIIGRMCAKESKKLGYETGKSHSANFGTVKTYHLDILKHVFEANNLIQA